jgi:pimeloyl-ACP methyl ester carboxylesterase
MDTFISKDGTHIAYQQTGSGPTLILVHGTSGNHTGWEPVLPILANHFSIYAMDRRGRGGSQIEGDYAIQREFEDVAGLVEVAYQNAPNQPVNLLGHSFGALCSLEAALLTEHLDNLVLYEPPQTGIPEILPPGLITEWERLLNEGNREGLLRIFFKGVGLSEKELADFRAKPSWSDTVALAHTILREIKAIITQPRFDPAHFKNLTVPTLLLVGSKSEPWAVAGTKEIPSALPNSQIVELSGQGHLIISDNPELFTKPVITFLQESP